MSFKSFVIKVLPKFILNGLKIRRDRMQLAKLESETCDAANLAKFSTSQLEGIFRNQETDELWQRAQSSLQEFSIPNMTGGINPGDRRALFYLVTSLGVTNVLEIGTHIGASTIHLATAIQGNAKRQQKHPSLTTVDIADVNDTRRRPWIEHGSTHSPKEMTESLGFDSFVEFKTCQSLKFLAGCEKKFDLIFLDGDHSAKNTYLEIPRALERLNEGGAILLHDFFPDLKPLWSDGNLIPGPCLAVKKLVGEGNSIGVLPLGKLPWPTKLESNLTNLALLTGV